MQPVIRPATRKDIEAYSDMKNKPTIVAWVGDLDGRIIAIGGVALFHGRWIAFLDLTEEARRYKVSIAKAARTLFAWADQHGVKYIYADADKKEPKAIAWLHRLGFELDHRTNYLYRWSKK